MTTLPLVSILDELELDAPPAKEEAGLGALRTQRGLLPLESVDLAATIDGLTAYLRLTQTFVNVHDVPLEATYIFPLPERAAVQRFRLRVGDRVVEGELKERGQARREYREAIRKGHQAAITEEERPGVFTLRVGNIPPGESATVHLDLAQPLPCVDGEATFRFPLVVAPRYIPGTPLRRPGVGRGTVADTDAVPDASRISPPVLLPGFPNPVDLSLAVHFLPTDLAPAEVRSSLHTVVEEGDADGLRLRVLAGERLNRDFILRFKLAERAVRTALTLHPDADGTGGTFALTVLPPALADQPTRPRDVVFVLDRSGSMNGWKMVTARRAVMRLVETLTDQDRFTAYAFDGEIETPPAFDGDRLVAGTFANRTAAIEFLGTVKHRGGTEMAGPLDLALSRLLEHGSDGERDKVLVLITDGQVGNENQMLKRFGDRLRHVRVHALGIDQAVNAGFLQQLADLGGGSSTLVESEDRLEVAIDEVQRKIGTPVLTGLKLVGDGVAFDAASVVPGRLPDLFAGTPVVVLGRYAGSADGGLTLVGQSADGGKWAVQVPAKVAAMPALPALWARQRLRDLEDRYAIAAAKGLEREIVALSLRFGVLCRFTAYLAVDRSRIVNAGGEQHEVTQAVDLPAGWAERSPRRLEACAALDAECDDEAAETVVRRKARMPAPSVRGRKQTARPAKPAEKKKDASNGLLQTLGAVAGSIYRGVQALFGMARGAAANPVDRSRFVPEVDALLAAFRAATTHPARLGALEATLRRLYALVQQLVQAGDLSAEVVRLGQVVEALSQAATNGSPDAATLTPVWADALAALEAYRTAAEPDGFWK